MGIRVMWSELPSEILELIASLLLKNTITDYKRFGAVCKSWHSVSLEMPTNLRTQIPWLMVYSHNESRFSFFSFFNSNTFYLDQSPDSRRRFCSGSSRGWFFMADEESPTSLLVNPITRAQVLIPPVTALPAVVKYTPCNERGQGNVHYVYKTTSGRIFSSTLFPDSNPIVTVMVKRIVLSVDPSLNKEKNCVMMCISHGYNGLVLCKPGDTTWTVVKDKDCSYNDLAYWNGEFYAVDDQGRIIVVCDLETSPKAKQTSSPTTFKQITSSHVFDEGVYHLVESSGELLLVRRHSQLFHMEPAVNLESVPCQAFKRDRIKQEWLEVKHLGNHSLFLSGNSSFSVLSSNYPGIKPNCIYFVNPYPKYKCGIYNVEDNSFEPFHTNNYEEMRKAVWITSSTW